MGAECTLVKLEEESPGNEGNQEGASGALSDGCLLTRRKEATATSVARGRSQRSETCDSGEMRCWSSGGYRRSREVHSVMNIPSTTNEINKLQARGGKHLKRELLRTASTSLESHCHKSSSRQISPVTIVHLLRLTSAFSTYHPYQDGRACCPSSRASQSPKLPSSEVGRRSKLRSAARYASPSSRSAIPPEALKRARAL